jgi:hypothetical protein
MCQLLGTRRTSFLVIPSLLDRRLQYLHVLLASRLAAVLGFCVIFTGCLLHSSRPLRLQNVFESAVAEYERGRQSAPILGQKGSYVIQIPASVYPVIQAKESALPFLEKAEGTSRARRELVDACRLLISRPATFISASAVNPLTGTTWYTFSGTMQPVCESDQDVQVEVSPR